MIISNLISRINLTTSKHWEWDKARVMGCYLSNPQRQVQEHLETIYYWGWIRLTIIHKNRFVHVNYY